MNYSFRLTLRYGARTFEQVFILCCPHCVNDSVRLPMLLQKQSNKSSTLILELLADHFAKKIIFSGWPVLSGGSAPLRLYFVKVPILKVEP